jgi:hypothetical protein
MRQAPWFFRNKGWMIVLPLLLAGCAAGRDYAGDDGYGYGARYAAGPGFTCTLCSDFHAFPEQWFTRPDQDWIDRNEFGPVP